MFDYKSFKEKMQSSNTATKLGIDNKIPSDLECNLKTLYAHYTSLVQVSDIPVHITSGFRCPALNKAVGGVSNSNHMKCRAFDFAFQGVSSKSEFLSIFNALRDAYIVLYKVLFDENRTEATRRFNHHFIVYPERFFVHYQIKDGYLSDYVIPMLK